MRLIDPKSRAHWEDTWYLPYYREAENGEVKGLTATQKQVKALNAQFEMMRRDRILTEDQKREKIDRLMAIRNKLVQQAVERVNPYFNK